MRIFKSIISFLLLLPLITSCGHRETQTASYNVIPKPQSVVLADNGQNFVLSPKTVISYNNADPQLEKNALYLKEELASRIDVNVKVTESPAEKDVIYLTLDPSISNPEGYVLSVGENIITITGASPAGNFYGVQTLLKSIPESVKSNVEFPAVTITDEPRFGYRGAHFDVSRHFFPVDSVKSFIDMMALHNLNRFHWHLTDDQGWRVEIKSRPKLTEIGSKRPGTVIGHNTGVYDSIPVEGYYTQDEIKDIVDYAAQRYITIIPEIDLPGHMLAALAAYPELGCEDKEYEIWQQWGVSEDILCAGKDETYVFLDDVLGEVADLFPGQLFHIGGDESPRVNWENCEICQAKIVELGLKTDAHSTKEAKLQSHVMQHASDFLATKGKRVIGWDEILEGGASPDAIIMSWRGEAGGIEAARKGHDVIMTPNNYMYFDYYQTLDRENEPEAIGGYVPVEKVYSYEPISSELTPEEGEHILGVQANLWTEYIPTYSQAEYMELPRMAALSEVQWSNQPKDYDDFVSRLPQIFNLYDARGYNYSTHVYDINGGATSDAADKQITYSFNTPKSVEIHYTTDGSEPTEASPLYTEPLKFDKGATIKAASLKQEPKRVYTDSFTVNKATWKNIKLETPPHPGYAKGGPQVLVDGVFGTTYNIRENWLGFNGEKVVAVVDLEDPTEISSVTIRNFIDTGSWIFDARGIKVDVSDNGTSWTTIGEEALPSLQQETRETVEHTLSFSPLSAKQVRVTVDVEKSIPEWHGGNGKPGFVFLDEIIIN